MNKEIKNKLKVILAMYSFAKAQNKKQKKQIEEDIVKQIGEVFNIQQK